MRNIKFRAIPENRYEERIDNPLDSIEFYTKGKGYDGIFVYGNLNGSYILGETVEADKDYYHPSYWINIDKNTIGQYTGLEDKNGKEIYEGDIYHQGDRNILYVVEYTHDCSFMGRQIKTKGSLAGLAYWREQIEVIGNIYENPELLKDDEHAN